MKKNITLLIVVLLFYSSGTIFGESILKVVPDSDLKILDPIWTTAYTTRNHGYMIYDTLFALDENLIPRPQMVESYTLSADNLTWTFTLRPGLRWHDGKPVTAEDCVTSLQRWGKRDGMGQLLFKNISSLTALDDKTIVMKLKEPYGFVLESLAKISSNVPFMMPKRVAETDPYDQITEYIGSGPFIFQLNEWIPGSKAVYLKNNNYVPRKEPPSWASGGKIARVDRVEWYYVPDQTTAVNALKAGEVDFLDFPNPDLIPLLEQDPEIVVSVYDLRMNKIAIRFNHAIPPFDNLEIRKAAMMAINQEDFLKAVVGSPKTWKTCYSFFACGTPYATEIGSDILKNNSIEKAKKQLKAANYDGRKVVILQPTDVPAISKLSLVAADALRKIGMNVEIQAMDWATVIARRANKMAVEDGGWNIFTTLISAVDLVDPTSIYFSGDPQTGWAGWAADTELEKYKLEFVKAKSVEERKLLASKVQERMYEIASYIPVGNIYTTVAYRKNLYGVIKAPVPFYWNILK